MAHTIAQTTTAPTQSQAPAAHDYSRKHNIRTAEAIAAQVVAIIGARRTNAAFIDAGDFTELAPRVADAVLGWELPSLDRQIQISDDLAQSKMTHAEWSVFDDGCSAKNAQELAALEAGILIGVALERARRGKKGGR